MPQPFREQVEIYFFYLHEKEEMSEGVMQFQAYIVSQPLKEQVKNVFFHLHEKMPEGAARVV